MTDAVKRYRAEWRLVARATTAAALSFVIAEWLALPQSYWAVISALIVVQLSLGGTIAAGFDRFLGTLVGAVLAGGAACASKLWGLPALLTLVLTLAPLAFLAALYPGFRVAPLTAAIVLLATPSSASPIEFRNTPHRRDRARHDHRYRGVARRVPFARQAGLFRTCRSDAEAAR